MWDDDFNIYQNVHFKSGDWKAFWREPYMGFYIPLTYTIWHVLAQFFGTENSLPFEILNFSFHLINAGLLFFYVRLLLHRVHDPLANRLPDRKLKGEEKKKREAEEKEAWSAFVKDRDWVALLAAMVYLFHPLQVGAVAWHSGFRDLLSHFWAFTTLIVLVRSQSTRSILLALGLFFLSLLSKPSSVALPVVVGVLTLFLPGLKRKPLLIFIGITLLVGLYFSNWTRQIQSQYMLGLQSAEIPDRPFIIADAYGFYIQQFFGGKPLSADYGRTPPRVLNWNLWHETLPWLIGFLVIVPLLFWRRWREMFLFCGLWVIPLAPVSGIVPFNFQRISTVADHYFIPALPAFCFALASLAMKPPAWTREKSLGWLLIPMILVWAGMTHQRIPDWRESEVFFKSIVRTNPYSHSANNYLGYFAFQKQDYRLAEKYFRQATASLPISAISSGNLAFAWLRQGRNQEVVDYLKDKVKDPDFIAQNMVHKHVIAVNHLALGLALANLEKYAPAYEAICEMFVYGPQPSDHRDGVATLKNLAGILGPTAKPCPHLPADVK